MATVKVDTSNFQDEVLNSVEPVIVDFWAEWCGPCKMIAPSLEEISVEMAGKVKVAIRGGGHTPWAGAANIHDGLVIDLRKLAGVKVDQEKKMVSIGAGERWGSVYKTLAEQGLATYGGRVSSAGCAGLILGGKLRSI